MKILFNTYPVAFDCPGGGEIQLLKTKLAIEQSDCKHEVFLHDQWSPIFDKIDVVHHYSLMTGSITFCNYVKNQKKLPLSISPILWPKGFPYDYPLNEARDLLNVCHIAFPNSNMEGKLLSERLNIPIEKFHTVYNGIDKKFFNDSLPCPTLFTEHFKLNKPFVLNVANIEHRKNQENLIQAILKTDLDLVVLGNIRDLEYYEKCMKIGGDRFKYLGYLPNTSELLKSAYLACEVFCLPSYLETPGLAALEAAAIGAKLVITEEGSTPEYFKDMAIYVNPYEVDSIFDGISNCLNSPKSDNLQKHICNNFTWDKAAQQSINGYLKIL